MADGRDEKRKEIHVFEGGNKAAFSLIWPPWAGIATEDGDWRNNGRSTQESLTRLQDVQCVLKIVVRIPSAVERSEVLQKD